MVEIDFGFTTDMKYAVAGTFTGGLSNKGYRLLKNEWYNVKTVYAVCPDEGKKVEGDISYPSLTALPEPVDVVIVVHKKELTTEVVREAAGLNPKPAIWFMPGTDSPESIEICEENDIKYAKSCIFMHRRIPGFKRFLNMHYIHSAFAKVNRISKQE